MHQQIQLGRLRNRIELLKNRVHGRKRFSHLDHGGILENLGNECADFSGHRRGKKQRLAVAGHFGNNGPYRLDESHVVHSVRFVEHQDFHVRKIDTAALAMVKESSRCGNDNVGALAQAVELSNDIDSAVH